MPYAPPLANTRDALLFLLLHLSTRRGDGGVVVLLVVAIEDVDDDEEHKDEERDVPRFLRASVSEIILLLSLRVVVFPADVDDANVIVIVIIIFCV